MKEILEARGKKYGPFPSHATITQGIKNQFKMTRAWDKMPLDMKESLEMIAHKIGRILNGDPFYRDSWDDIAGYALLVAENLEDEKPAA